jgi:predicted ATPase
LLTSFRAVNFRAFADLTVDRLGRVNLITGRNGVGKTNLLEALAVWARGARPDDLANLLEARDEDEHRGDGEGLIRALFHDGRHDAPIHLGPVDGTDPLRLSFGFQIRRRVPETDDVVVTVADEPDPVEDSRAALVIDSPRGQRSVRASAEALRSWGGRKWPERMPSWFVFASGLDRAEIDVLWRGVAGFPFEQDVVRTLRLFAEVDKIHVLHGAIGTSYVRVTLVGGREPVTMASLGDGIQRVFHLALALANARGGILLVDEIENGVHYSVQPELWTFLFQAAATLDVQVFATTHSWDCVEAFQRAAAASPQDGVLIRVAQEAGRVRAYTFTEAELDTVTRARLEVR